MAGGKEKAFGTCSEPLPSLYVHAPFSCSIFRTNPKSLAQRWDNPLSSSQRRSRAEEVSLHTHLDKDRRPLGRVPQEFHSIQQSRMDVRFKDSYRHGDI